MADSKDEVVKNEDANGSEQETPSSETNEGASEDKGSGTEGSSSEGSGSEASDTENAATNKTKVKYDNVVPSSYFKTPCTEDFYENSVDYTYLYRMDELVNGEENADHEKAAFYMENPKKDVGVNSEAEAVSCARISITKDSIDQGYINGNTIRMSIDSLQGPNSDKIKESLKEKTGDNKCENMNIRLVGISAPQTPVWANERNIPIENINYCEKTYSEVKGQGSYTIASNASHEDNAKLIFVSVGGAWYEAEVTATSKDGKFVNFRWCLFPGDKDNGDTDAKAANNLKRLIDNAEGEVYLDIDKNPNGFKSRFENISNNEEAMALLKSWHEIGKMSDDGYTIVTEDKCANFMAVAYIKRSDKWINLAKAALTDDSNKAIAPDTSYDGQLKDDFRPQRYDKNNITYADAYYDPETLDDRDDVQKQATGMDWGSLHEWTVTLGDVTLFVPPSNITITTETEKQEMPLLRAHGSMHKVGKRIKRSMSMNLYFNEDRGINGYKIAAKTPSGEEVTYSVNGLRSLISQSKFIPFIPIENGYINNVLHVQAVIIENFVISSVPGFPRLIKGTILMTEFNYGVYIPEAVTAGMVAEAEADAPETEEAADGTTAESSDGKEDESEDDESEESEEIEYEYCNYFSGSFNWSIARWYYQRALIKGDNMKGLKFNSDMYNARMIQNRTALIPMSFMSPKITFFLANSDYLDEMMRARAERRKRSIQFDKNEEEGINKLGLIYDKIADTLNDSEFQQKIQELKDKYGYIKPPDDYSDNTIIKKLNELGGYTGFISHAGLYEKGNSADRGVEATKTLNGALAVLKAHIDQVNEEAGETILTEPQFEHYNSGNKDERRASWGISFKVNIDAIKEDFRQENIRANIGADIGISGENIFKDGRVYIPIYATYKPIGSDWWNKDGIKEGEVTDIGLDMDYKDVKFLEGCKNHSSNPDSNKKKSAQIDPRQLENMYYDKYVTAHVENWSASMTNHYSRMNICDLSGASPQYLGGDDIKISLDIVTTDMETVDKLNAMPTICAAFGRRYRMVMPSSVVKAQAEFIQFLGVSEILIDDVQVDTVPGQPKLWKIHIDITSDDRTLRMREALDKIEGINAGVVGGGLSFLDVMNPDYSKGKQNKPGEDSLITRTVKTYFDLNKTIAKAELYPDLELPTIEEMENIGWDFIRYKTQEDRVYVDPDFYFMYPNNLTSQMLREFILAKQEGKEAHVNYIDNKGGAMTIEPSTRMGFNIISRNAIAQTQKDQNIKLQNAQNQAKAKQLKENLKDEPDDNGIHDAAAVDSLESWAVCDDIKANFMEKTYKKEYDSYVARTHAASISESQQQQNQGQGQGEDEQQGQGEKPKETEEGQGQDTNKDSSTDSGGENPPDDSSSNGDTGSGDSDKNKDSNGSDKAESTENTGKKKTIDPEGKLINTYVEEALQASSLIEQYLKEPITEKVPDKPLVAIEREVAGEEQSEQESTDTSTTEETKDGKKETENGESSENKEEDSKDDKKSDGFLSSAKEIGRSEKIRSVIAAGVNKFFKDSKVIEIFSKIHADVTDEQFYFVAVDIIFSAACAATGEKEYSDKKKSRGWEPDPNFFGYKVGGSQDASNREQAHNTEEAIEYATEFGCFGIKQYEANEFQRITGEKAVDVWGGGNEINETRYLIDPYYRSLEVDKIREYKKGCINSPTYCTIAFLRLCLYWLKKLIDCQAFPSINLDVLRKSTDVHLGAQKQIEENSASTVTDSKLAEHIGFFKKRGYALDAGKIWTAAILASGEGNTVVMDCIQKRDYRALNGYILGLARPQNSVPVKDGASLRTRKMLLALIGKGRIKDAKALGVRQDKEASEFMSYLAEKKYLEAAEDPSRYCVDSCLDMITHDARGRMLRAFPTYYMLFIDEGREVGMWKLHDNFYNSMAIASIEVVKSRKIPADTAHIVMSNFYKSFMTEGEDYSQANRIREASWSDTFASVFGPIPGVNKVVGALTGQDLDTTTYGQRLEAERKNKPPEDRVRLRPGARIHVRMGYGSNAVGLPIVFNGSIAEVSSEEAVEIVAQGDGIELMNPIMDDDSDAVDIVHDDEFFCMPANGATPRNIVNAFLTNIGGKVARFLKAAGAQHLLGRSPYGIYHFGNPDYTELFSKGEPTQNIFDACAKPAWGSDDSITAKYALDEAPHISFDVFQKTVWDIVNICRSVSPDHICGVAPFDYRSTLFMGHPRFYYAYTYTNNNGMGVQEKRKPYQQFHIYDSSSDIIGNGIIATKSKMKTVALGLYTKVESLYIKNQEKVGPLYADIDIYPENQKTMIVDTQLSGKGVSYAGAITNSFTQRLDFMFDDKGKYVSHEKIAWRMTAAALKDSVKEMYAGDLVVMGDATVKPHDRIYIADTYQGISGQATVKEVVHSMSIDRGFTTTISPDCICTVDDRFESVTHPWYATRGAFAHAAVSMVAMNTALLLAGKFAGEKFLSAKGLIKGAKKLNPVRGIKKKVYKLRTARNLSIRMAKYLKKIKKGKTAVKIGATLAGIGAQLAIGPVGWTALAIEVLGLAASVAFGAYVDAFLEMTMKNLQVLQIYPLRRYGLCWTAGVDGSKGLVVGSPTHNQQGALTKTMAHLFGSDPNGVEQWIGWLFSSDNMNEIADKYNKQLNVVDDEGNPTDTNDDYGEIIAYKGMQNGEIPNDYRGMQIIPRVVYDNNSDEFLQTKKYFSVMDKENWVSDTHLQHAKLVSQDPRLRRYMEEQPSFFRIVHEEPALNKENKKVDSLTIHKNGAEYYIKTMHQPLKNGGECIDVPFLNKEAIHVLYEIVRRTKNNMPSANASDQNEAYEQTKGSFVALESALRIGDDDEGSMGATGFTFIIEAREKAIDPMQAAIKALDEEIADDAEKNDLLNGQIFTCKFYSNERAAITVLMPKLTSERYKKAKEEEEAAKEEREGDPV